MRYKIITIIGAVLATGCAKHPMDPTLEFQPPKYVEQMPSKQQERTENLGSLFGKGDTPLFGDKKAMRVNDIVTVTITESIESSSSGKKQLAKTNNSESSLDATVTPDIYWRGKQNSIGQTGLSLTLPTMNSSRNFTGTASASRTEALETTITARVIKILSNGNYFISGSREILMDGQKQILRVTGVIRSEDIDSSNTIDSKYISDAKILYDTEGDITESTNQNWFSKTFNAIAPW